MRTHTKKALAILATIPLLAGLSACRSTTTITIGADKNVTFESEFGDDSGILKLGGATCDDLANELENGVGEQELGSLEVTDTSTDKEFACKITASETSSFDAKTLSETDDAYILDFDQPDFVNTEDLQQIESLGQKLDFSLTVVMPGDVTKAPEGFTIDGTKATTTDLNTLSQPIRIESAKHKSPASVAKESASSLSPSTILIICLAGIALAAVIALILVSRKRKRKLDATAPTYSAAVDGVPQPGVAQPGVVPQPGATQPGIAQPGSVAAPGTTNPNQPGAGLQ